MSHVAKIDIQIRDLEALKKAAAVLGLEFRENQTTYRWYGRSVGDYPLPEGFTTEDLGKCEHAIGVPGAAGAYEIGIVRNKNGAAGYSMLWDFYQNGYGLVNAIYQGAGRGNEQARTPDGAIGIIKQRYAAEAAKIAARRQGFMATEKKLHDGSLVVTLRR